MNKAGKDGHQDGKSVLTDIDESEIVSPLGINISLDEMIDESVDFLSMEGTPPLFDADAIVSAPDGTALEDLKTGLPPLTGSKCLVNLLEDCAFPLSPFTT